MEMATNGGSSDSDTKALAAIPTGLPSASSAQTAMTPLGKHPKAKRSTNGSAIGLSWSVRSFESGTARLEEFIAVVVHDGNGIGL